MCVPNKRVAVEQVATAFVRETALQSELPLSKNVTVPVGVPPNCPATVAVKVTDWLRKDGLTDEDSEVVVFARFTCWPPNRVPELPL